LGLRDGKWKLFDTEPPLLFDLENDLSEQFDLYKSHTGIARYMKQKERIENNSFLQLFENFFFKFFAQSLKA